MQKNKKSFFKALWARLDPPSLTAKNLFVLVSFIFFFGLSFFLIWERHFRYVKVSVAQDVIEKYKASTSSPSSHPVKQPVHSPQDNNPLLQVSNQLIALELIKGVLNNTLTIEDLKKFTQVHNTAPWIQPLAQTISSLEDIQSYAALETSLVLPPSSPPKAKSFYQQVLGKIRSLVSVRKVNDKDSNSLESLQNIQHMLQTHNLSGALSLFEKLSPEEKASLSSWEKKARDRLLLEQAQKTLLLQIANGYAK